MNLFFTQMDPIPGPVVTALEAKGWSCVHAPFRRVVLMDPPKMDLQSYDCLIITSKQAARWLLGQAYETLPPLAVVGGGTAALLQEHTCLFKDAPPANAAELTARLLEPESPRKCLFLRGATARDTLEKSLPSHRLDLATVYRTEKIEKIQPIRGPGVVYFQAPSTVADFWETYRKPPDLIGAIGKTTAAAIHARGWPLHFKPTRPELIHLVEQLPSPQHFKTLLRERE